MCDENVDISGRTWIRSVQLINKVGYMDGASAGQSDTFQSSFDIGYAQGLTFGLQLGFHEAMLRENKHSVQNWKIPEE